MLLVNSKIPIDASITIAIEEYTINLANVALTYRPVIPIIKAKTVMSVLLENATHTPNPAKINNIE
jgi:hypothetical protein